MASQNQHDVESGSSPSLGNSSTPNTSGHSSDEHITKQFHSIYTGQDGQSMLLAFRFGDHDYYEAILIPVYRPSKEWARTMVKWEDRGRILPVPTPLTSNEGMERWRVFRLENCGEQEIDIWKRLREEYRRHRPFWHTFMPFLRPNSLSERTVSRLNRPLRCVVTPNS